MPRAATPQLRIGISGWTYASWRGRFYPRGLPHRRELEYASRQFNSLEINGSFYRLQNPRIYKMWRDQAPESFVFAVKGSRFITHMKKLRDVEAPLARFFASGVLDLGPKLGPVLWQFPEQVRFDRAEMRERFARFLGLLPRAHEGRAIRHAFEIRHESFLDEAFFALLRAHNAALVVADTAGKWPRVYVRTADFAYARLHGATELYASGYGGPGLKPWASRARRWLKRGLDAYFYFDNDAKVHAPFDALALARELHLENSFHGRLTGIDAEAG